MIQKLLSLIRKAQQSPQKFYESSIGIIEGSGRFGEKRQPFSYEQAVRQFHGWCYAAATMNANAVASVPLRLYVRKGGGGDVKLWPTRSVSVRRKRWLMGEYTEHRPGPITAKALNYIGEDMEEVIDHPILDLLNSMNPYENGFGATHLRILYGCLTGNAYLHPVIGDDGVPVELWTLPSQWVWIIPDRETFIRGYVYGSTVQQAEQEYEPEEIIHFKRPNPRNLFYGLGSVEAAWAALKQTDSKMVMDLATYDNMARPDYMVAIKGGPGRDLLDKYEADVNSRLRGVRNSGKMMAVSGDVTVTPLNFSPKDMGDSNYAVEIIAACFGVPVAKLKANQNVAGGQAGESNDSYPKDTVLPLCNMDADVLNAQLLPMFAFERGDAVLCYDDPVPKNQTFEVDRAVRMSSAALVTIDELRSELGYDELEGGLGKVPRWNGTPLDKVGQLQPLGGFDAGMSGDRGRRDPEQRPDGSSAEDSEEDGAGTKTAHALRRPDGLPARGAGQRSLDGTGEAGHRRNSCCNGGTSQAVSMTALYHKAWSTKSDTPLGKISKAEEAFARDLAAIFAAQGGEINQQPNLSPSIVDRILSDPKWVDMVGRASEPFLNEVIDMGGKVGDAKLSSMGAPPAVGFDVTNPEVQKFVDRYKVKLATGVNEYTRVELRQLIGDGLDKGESIAQLNQRVSVWVEGDSATDRIGGAHYRADMISRTESARAYTAGEIESWKQSGVVEGKEWLLAPDPCEFCEAAAAQFNAKNTALDAVVFRQGAQLQGVDGGVMVLDYSDVQAPPLHPHCFCDLMPIIKET